MANDLQLIICAFDATGRADEVKKSLKELDDESPTVRLGDIAIVKKDPDGAISFHETGDHRTVVSKVAGTVAGGVAWFVYAFAGSLGYTAGPMVYNDAYNAAQSRLKDAGFPERHAARVGRAPGRRQLGPHHPGHRGRGGVGEDPLGAARRRLHRAHAAGRRLPPRSTTPDAA